jgi:D-alanyl-D-alanine carboxypeptidase
MNKPALRGRAVQTTAIGLALFVCACSQQTAPHGTPHSDEIASTPAAITGQIDRTADAWVGSGKAVGAVIEVAQSGRVIFARGYGRRTLDSDDPVTTRTQFRIGSLTKQFTAAAILQLVGEGKLSLDDHLSAYFPDFPRASEVTIRQLLTHTSGIHNYTEFGLNLWTLYQFTRDHTTAGWVAHIARQKPLYDFAPGTAWHYDNSGFFLLGAIVEKVSGQSLGQYFHDHLFQPLSMNDTALDGNSDLGPDRAEGYEHAGSRPGVFTRPIPIAMTVPAGAGALRSSTRDLLKWNDALFQGRVVRPDLVKTMMTPARLNDGRLASENRVDMEAAESHGEYGFGLRVGQFGGHPEIGHEGDIFGFNAAMDTYPDDQLTVVVLANTPAGAYELEKKVAAIFLTSAPANGAKPSKPQG